MNPIHMNGGVLVVGSVTADVTAFASRLPSRGETVLGDHVTLVLGGKGANQAVAAAKFGTPTWIAGCVGRDAFADIARRGLSEAGVRLAQLREVDAPTGVAHIRVDSAGDNDIVITPLANSELGEADVDRALEALSDRVSVLLLQMEIRPDITAYAARAGNAAGLKVIFDPAPALPVPDDVWPNVDYVTPNETEAALLTGIAVRDHDSAAAAAMWFLDRGVGSVVITLAERGALFATARGRSSLEAFPVTALDATAAGDAFTGTLGAQVSLGAAPSEAVTWAMAAGALAVTRRGASASLPNRGDIDALVRTRGVKTTDTHVEKSD